MSRADVLHWSPKDYLAEHKVARLDLTEHGAYHLLLWNMWLATDEQCIFPLDYSVLGGIWRLCPEEAERIVDSLMKPGVSLFTIVNRKKVPHLYSKRLHEQATAAQKFAESQAVRGRASGEARRKMSANRGSTNVGSTGPLDPIEPSLPRTPVSRSPVSPVDPSKTPVSSRSSGPQREERGSYPQDDPEPAIGVYVEKLGRDLTTDERRSVMRWVRVHGSFETCVQIGYAFQDGYGTNLRRIGGALKAAQERAKQEGAGS